jgi:hypothetical protein
MMTDYENLLAQSTYLSHGIEVEYLAEDPYSRFYVISSRRLSHEKGASVIQYVLRIAESIYPYYKIESDVATMEYMRAKVSQYLEFAILSHPPKVMKLDSN